MGSSRPRYAICAAIYGIFAFCAGAFAQGRNHAPGEIFTAGAGARALGMGGAYTALVNDASSLYYNPSGLGLLNGNQVNVMHAQLFEGAAYDYLSYVRNTSRIPGGYGLEVLRLGVGGADGRDAINTGTGDFGYSEMGYGFGAGFRGIGLPDMSLGLRGKILNRKLASSGDTLAGLDAGLQYGSFFNNRLNFGFVMQNALRYHKGDTQDNLLPLMRLGAAYKVAGPLTLTADVSDSKEFRAGTEYSFGLAAIRFGVQQAGFTFGGGILFRNAFALDMAVLSHPTLGMSQRMSLGYRFQPAAGKPRRMEAFAQEYLKNGILELEKQNYLKALRSLETALGIDPRLGESGWGQKTQRLRAWVNTMRLAENPDEEDVLHKRSMQASIGHQAIVAYLDRDESKAMLFAHIAHGQDPREPVFQKLLSSLSELTHMQIRREDIVPANFFISQRLQETVDAIYARRYDQAIRACKEALAMDPNNVLAWTRLGSAYFAAGDRVNAGISYRNALKLDDTNEKLKQFLMQQGLEQ